MGRKGSWFSAVKKALNPETKEKKDQKSKSKKRWFGKTKSEELDYEDLTANRLSALTKISLRQNLINDDAVDPISAWTALSGLEELVLRDNKLTKVPDASIFKKLLVFDVSFNEITLLQGLSKVSGSLTELYVSKNEVTKIEEIEHLHQLQILELGSNRLRVMQSLENMINLQELWLGRNRIKVVNLCGLECIKKIILQSNRLTSMAGFESWRNCT